MEMSLHESLWNTHRVDFPRHLGKAILYGVMVLFDTWLWEGHARHSEWAGDICPDSPIRSAAWTITGGTDVVLCVLNR